MKSRRHFVLPAIAAAMACLASVTPAHSSAASTVPEAPPPTMPSENNESAEPVGEVIESWALAPAGSLDPDAASNRPDLSLSADQGAVINDAVTLFNYGTVQLTFRVYATDAFNNDEGQFDLLPGDEEPTDVGSWVTVSQEVITVPPGKQATVPITITIPDDATPGDHTGAILASSPTLGTGPQGETITLDRRTGTRLYLRVNGPLFPELAVANLETSYQHSLNPFGGSATISYRIENRGNVRLAGSASASISGPLGMGSREITLPDVPELLPGEGINLAVDVADVPALLMSLTTVRVEPSGFTGAGAVQASSANDRTFTPPLALLLLLLAVLFALLARRAFLRHRRAGSPDGGAQARQPVEQPA